MILRMPEIPSDAPPRLEASADPNVIYQFGCVHVHLKKCVFQEHPYIFTKVNSFPPSTTAAPRTVSTVPVWLAAVLTVTGLLTGWVAAWLLLSCIAKRKKRLTTSAVELKGTSF